jgi:hypothetical protein
VEIARDPRPIPTGSTLQRATGAGSAVLLTKPMRLLSGDHDGTLIVPWPPNT